MTAPGSLFLVPNLLGAVPPGNVLPVRTIEAARAIGHWVVETPKAARAFLKSIGHPRPIAELSIHAMPDRPSQAKLVALLAPARAGDPLGFVSDAGCPAVADPGAALVAAAHGSGIPVVPLVGPSAVLLALRASGTSGQAFAFPRHL
ncbi:MAG: SAM-dependent methyltransferase, partial [Burkholderiales bacterium]|nr:SAM-dependent methyltransferase [Burkholderiales bacterium]